MFEVFEMQVELLLQKSLIDRKWETICELALKV
jgi:hypothetical protein